MPTKEQYLTLEFPTKGLDLNDEFEEQPPGTTAVGNNVRARDVLQQRIRGGSRPGLVKYIAQQIPEGTEVIQHLDVIVDPSEAALTQNFTSPDDTWVEISPGVWVPPGGAGWQPNPNVTQPQPPTGGISLVQKKQLTSDGTGGGVNVWGCDLDAAPTVGNILFVIFNGGKTVATTDPAPDFSYAVTNLAASTYTQINVDVDHNSGDVGGSTSYRRLAAWRRNVSSAISDRRVEVTMTVDNFESAAMEVLEYKKVNTTSPIDDSQVNSMDATSGEAVATGNVAINGQSEMLLAAFALGSGDLTTTPSSTLQVDFGDLLRVFELKPLSNPADNPAALANGSASLYSFGVIAFSVKKSP